MCMPAHLEPHDNEVRELLQHPGAADGLPAPMLPRVDLVAEPLPLRKPLSGRIARSRPRASGA